MPCPVCDATMENVGAVGQRIFWCPRCGTLKSESDSGEASVIETVESPAWTKVIEREIIRDVVKARGGRAEPC